MHAELAFRSRVRGCLLGGAIGDALGAAVEFVSLAEIRRLSGADGVREYLPQDDHYGLITDDTQMTLFTVEGLIRAGVRTDRGIGFTVDVLRNAYDRWLYTQQLRDPSALPRGDNSPDGWLIQQEWLYSRRAPGATCIAALNKARQGHDVHNDSKGCGGVMRSAPFGLVPADYIADDDWVFDSAAVAAGFTHGHPTGQLASGAFALIIRRLVDGADLPAAVDAALAMLIHREHHEETTAALRAAVRAASADAPSSETLETLGGGWIAEEALAIGVYAALAHPDDTLAALALAVTHSGDSDSTGSVCGNILGAWRGDAMLPPELAFEVEGRGTILELADDFVFEFTKAKRRLHGDYGPHTRWIDRYPGW